MLKLSPSFAFVVLSLGALGAACSPSSATRPSERAGAGGATSTAVSSATTISSGISTTTGITTATGGAGGGTNDPSQPETCDAAAAARTYVGCEFWPTVTYNPVYSVFDFAAVVANTSPTKTATVTIERKGMQIQSKTIAPGDLEKFYLPWVPELKGADFDKCTGGNRPTASVRVDKGAYKLTSDIPVIAWQFNPLEYKAQGGPPGKTWSCPYPPDVCNGNGHDCLSVSNDAALLLPTSAMTPHYRLFGKSGARGLGGAMSRETAGAFTITATRDGTTVDVYVPKDRRNVMGSPTGFLAGSGVTATPAGGKATFEMNAGDVIQLLGVEGPFYDQPDFDMSGGLVDAHDKPVQVISSIPITDIPVPETPGNGYADHVEETVLPAEVIGKHYLVAPPTTANLTTVGHYVRIYGNADGTNLTYAPSAPPGAPSTLNAGDVVELSGSVNTPFEVTGNQAFAVGSYMMGGQAQDPNPSPDGARGDPAFSLEVTVEQFRKKYIFLAPDDYDVAVADILVPNGADVTIDGAPLSAQPTRIGATMWSIVRQKLDPGPKHGTHVLEATKAVGLQVVAFGHATGIYYPGGLNLDLITKPPPPPN